MVDFGGNVQNSYDNQENMNDTIEILVEMTASNDGNSLISQVCYKFIGIIPASI